MKVYTVNEIAKVLNVTAFTVRTYIKKGMLLAEKMPKGLQFEYVISEDNLEHFKNNFVNPVELPEWLLKSLREQEEQIKNGTIESSPWPEAKKRIEERVKQHEAKKLKKLEEVGV